MAKRAKAADSGEVKEGGAAGDSEERVFTETELNAELEARLESERGKLAKELKDGLRSAGVEGIDGVRELVKRLRDKEEAVEALAVEGARAATRKPWSVSGDSSMS